MSGVVAEIVADGDARLIDVARRAHACRQRLYLDEHGRLVIAVRPLPGWVRIAVKIKPSRMAAALVSARAA